MSNSESIILFIYLWDSGSSYLISVSDCLMISDRHLCEFFVLQSLHS